MNLRVKTNKFEIESTAYLKGKDLKKGVNSPFQFDGKYYVIKVNEKLDPKQKEFSEAKGNATSDYQNFLEKTWLEEIAKKHTIKVNSDVLYSLGK